MLVYLSTHKKIIILLTAITFNVFSHSCFSKKNISIKLEKVNGVSFVAPDKKIIENPFNPVVNINSNWIAIMPYAFTEPNKLEVSHNLEWQWWGEKYDGISKTIELAQEKNLKIMLKPHLWVKGQGWAGDLSFKTEQDWEKWEKSYQEYIIKYAKLAQEKKVDIFCIGVELRNSVKLREKFWLKLITETREIYKGKLIYAANWDNYKNVTFWNKLDYIGIDAYFPLSDEKNPSVETLSKSWNKHLIEIESTQEKYNKPIIFTEYGYRSVDHTTKSPWESSKGSKFNEEAQLKAYKAIFNTFWQKDWFKGGFIWKWYINNEESGGLDNSGYTPQNKSSENYIKDYFSKYTNQI